MRTGFSGPSVSCFYHELFSLGFSVVLPISIGSLIFFLPQRGNKVIRWYTICICIIELLLATYTENYKWIHFFSFNWMLGIDGISIGPILLTGFITTFATLAARLVTRDFRLYERIL